MGDSRSKPEIFKAISDQVNQLNPDLILSVGDLVGSGGYYNEWEKYYFGVAGDVINHIPMISALGDHEGDSDDGELFTHFLFPHKDYHKLWFSFDYEDAHFIALDYRHPYNEEMIEWFKKDMTASKAKWKFVTMHRPSYNLGGHRSNWGREIWPKLFRDYKVDIVFAGHSHIYERFYPTRPLSQSNSWPVTYITTGGAGAPLYEVVQDPALAFAKSINHFVYISLNKNQLDLKTYLMDGTILDKISFSKREKEYEESYSSLIKPQENLDLYGFLPVRFHKIWIACL